MIIGTEFYVFDSEETMNEGIEYVESTSSHLLRVDTGSTEINSLTDAANRNKVK